MVRTLATITLAIILLLAATSTAHAARASCYGPGLYGNKMANGKRLTKHTLGIAHRTLPLGTRLVVRHKNRRVIVVVTDRGPYIRGRQFDLTSAAARRLGYTSCTRFGVRTIRTHRAR